MSDGMVVEFVGGRLDGATRAFPWMRERVEFAVFEAPSMYDAPELESDPIVTLVDVYVFDHFKQDAEVRVFICRGQERGPA